MSSLSLHSPAVLYRCLKPLLFRMDPEQAHHLALRGAGLLSAMPHASDRNPPLPTIRGYVPRPGMWPTGCRFSNRCDFRIAACDARVPLVGADRMVRCVRAGELEPGRAP